jgi:non-specific serine/threonine protein kinase
MAYLHDLEAANNLHTRALHCSRELGDVQHAALALVFIGGTIRGNTERAITVAEEGLAHFRELDHKSYIAMALYTIGEIVFASGDWHRTRRLWEESLALAQQTGDTRQINVMTSNLAFLAMQEGHHEHALELGREALRMARAMNNWRDLASDLVLLAGSFAATGQPQRAAEILGVSEATLEHMGALLQPTEKSDVAQIVAAVRAQLGEGAFEAAWAEGRRMSLEQAVAEALEENP